MLRIVLSKRKSLVSLASHRFGHFTTIANHARDALSSFRTLTPPLYDRLVLDVLSPCNERWQFVALERLPDGWQVKVESLDENRLALSARAPTIAEAFDRAAALIREHDDR